MNNYIYIYIYIQRERERERVRERESERERGRGEHNVTLCNMPTIFPKTTVWKLLGSKDTCLFYGRSKHSYAGLRVHG